MPSGPRETNVLLSASGVTAVTLPVAVPRSLRVPAATSHTASPPSRQPTISHPPSGDEAMQCGVAPVSAKERVVSVSVSTTCTAPSAPETARRWPASITAT